MDKDIKKLGLSFPAFRLTGQLLVVDVVESEMKNDSDNQLLDVIYAPDPFTGLPQSDIAVYLSDKVDPAIREFVASQLMTPNPDFKGVVDAQSDILFDLIRQDGESVADYAVRIRDIVSVDSVIRVKEADVVDNQTES